MAPIGSEGRRRSREDEEEEALKRKHLQEEHLSKVSQITLNHQLNKVTTIHTLVITDVIFLLFIRKLLLT